MITTKTLPLFTSKSKIIFLFVVAVIISSLLASVVYAAITTLTVDSPVAGNEWRGTQEIDWSFTGGTLGDTVNIVYSTNDFSSQAVIATDVPYDSSPYIWNTTSFPESTNFKIRFIDDSSFVYDTSDAFTIDNTAPSTALATTTGTLGLNDFYKGASAPTFDLVCGDGAGSGCLETWYQWDTDGFLLYTGTITAPEGVHTLQWFSRDQAVDANGFHNTEATHSQVIKVDTTTPTVSVTSTTANGFYNEPDNINVTLNFSEAVTSSDSITVTLETGVDDRTCLVSPITNSATADCIYTVQGGDVSADLNTNSIVVDNAGTIVDIAGNAADLTPTTNLAANKNIVIDTTAPAAFSTGSVTITGGTVVPAWWNSTNTGANVVVPIVSDTSLVGGTIQIRGEADGSFENLGAPYTILAADVVAGTKTISLTDSEIEALSGFTDGDVLTFTAILTDNAGNSTTGTNSSNTFTVDQTLPSVDADIDKEVKVMTMQAATASDAGSGISTYAWSQQAGSGTITFGTDTTEDTNVSADTDDTYTIRLTVTDVAGNSAFDNATFVWDTTAPTLAAVTLVPTPTNDTTPSYTFNANHVGWLSGHTGGTVGYTGACGAGDLVTAVAGNNTTTYTVTPNVTYTDCDLTVTDAAGNTSTILEINDFEVDTIAALIDTVTTEDTDLDGSIDKATLNFNDEINDSTIVFADFSINGINPTATSTEPTPNDDVIVLIFGTQITGTEAKTLDYGSVAKDLAGNSIAPFSELSIDAAGPILLSAITTDTTHITALFSEDLDGTTVTEADFTITVPVFPITTATEGPDDGTVIITLGSAMSTGETPTVNYVGSIKDLAGVIGSNGSTVAVDGVAPLLSPVSIISDNASTTLAMEGDEITLTFTSSETITTPTVTIQGVAATVDAPSGNNWTAHRVMTISDTQGPVTFSIEFADDALPTPNSGVTVTAVTDSSSVFFDSVNPNVNAGTDKEVNALVNQDATVSDDVPSSGIATYAWTKQSGPGAITFGSASAEDTTISADTDGTYTIRLTVTDNAGNVTFDEITFIWDTTPPEPISASPWTTGVPLAAGTATVTYDEDIVLLDTSRVLLENKLTFSSHKGAVAVQGGNGASAILNIDYTGLSFGTDYRINVKAGNPITGVGAAVRDVAGNWVINSWVSLFTTVIDTVVPVVNSFSAGSITTTGAVLSVTTDEAANCSFAMTDSAYSSMTAMTTTGGTSHSHTLTGLTSSTGYDVYVRCADTTAQTNTMTTSAHVSFTTLTPDIAAPVITNIQVGSFTQTGVTITWNTDENATSRVEYGTSSSYGTLSAVDGTADNTSHSVTLSGLSAGTVYHFRVLSTDALSNAGMSSDAIFTTSPADPDTATPPDPTITTSIATVNSDSYTISGIAGADVPSASIRTISVYNGLALAGTTIVPIGQTGWALVVSLNQNTTNSFTAVSTDAAGNSSAASVAVVITEDETVGADLTAPDAPVFTTVDITVDADTYELTGTTTADSDIQTVFIECGCSVVGSVNVPAGETAWALTVSLDQNTANVFTARSADASGNISGSSASVTITEATTVTPDTSAPLSSNIQATSIITTGATITWDTDEGATSLVEYGLTSEYGSMTSVDPTLVTSHSVALSGLLANTTYHYRVVSDDTLGNSASSTDNTFTTAIDDTATLAVTGIDAVDTFAVDDDTYANGWSWTFHVTVPTSETEFALKFSDFISGANTIFAGSNIRYYTAQSTEADTIGEAVTITGANTYPATISLDSDADAVAPGRQINVVVEMKVPAGSAGGSYSAQYGVTSN